MSAADVISVCRTAAQAKVVAVHMEAINHCLLTRQQLAAEAQTAGIPVIIPRDGEWVG
jgi:hypothetical protein